MSSLYFKEQGKGFPLIFIHGFCETSEVWDSVIDPLSKFFRVIVIDLPGFGKSINNPVPDSIDQAGETVIQLIEDDLNLNKCIIFGHSLGGYVVLSMVEKNPDLFLAFGLIHSTAYADSDDRKISRNKVIEFVNVHGVAPFIQSFVPPLFYNQSSPKISWAVNMALKTPKETLIGYTKAMRDRPDRSIVIKTLRRPVLFLAGQEDTVIPYEVIEEQAAIAKRANITVLEGAGHMGMLEKPEETMLVILEFVKGNLTT